MLPEAVRSQVAALAATALAALPAEAVPASLRKVARFTPAKRARLGAADLLAAVEAEPLFRQQVVEVARRVGTDEATLAYLQASPGWEELVAQAAAHEAAATEQRSAADLEAQVAQLTAALAEQRGSAEREQRRLRDEAEQARAEAQEVRRKARDVGARLGRAEQVQRDVEAALEQARAEAHAARQEREAAVRRLTDRLADAERALEQAKQGAREGQRADQLRLRLLLDAVVGAAQGLRRELALPPAEGRPADTLAGDYPAPAVGATARGQEHDDPARLDALLAVPTTHLLVDGYNVTKTGYGGLALEAQRARLLSGAGALAARTGAEVTVVFDGAEGTLAVAPVAPRGVRLLFSRRGETADEVLRRLVRHEPAGRPVVVVSSDKEVAEGVRAAGAEAVGASALLRLLERSVGGGS